MPLESSKTARRATGFTSIKVGAHLRKASQTTTAPVGQDFHNDPAVITRFDKNTFSLASPGAIGANSSIEVSVTLPDAQVSATLDGSTQMDLVVLNAPLTLETGLVVGSERITALNTLSFRIFNSTGAPIIPATNTYMYFLVRS